MQCTGRGLSSSCVERAGRIRACPSRSRHGVRERRADGSALEHADGARAPALIEALDADRDGSRPRPLVHHDDGLDDAVGRLVLVHPPDGERRPLRCLALGPTSTRREHDALRQVAVDVVVDPPGELLEVSRAGERLDDAVGEARRSGSGSGNSVRRAGWRAKNSSSSPRMRAEELRFTAVRAPIASRAVICAPWGRSGSQSLSTVRQDHPRVGDMGDA